MQIHSSDFSGVNCCCAGIYGLMTLQCQRKHSGLTDAYEYTAHLPTSEGAGRTATGQRSPEGPPSASEIISNVDRGQGGESRDGPGLTPCLGCLGEGLSTRFQRQCQHVRVHRSQNLEPGHQKEPGQNVPQRQKQACQELLV